MEVEREREIVMICACVIYGNPCMARTSGPDEPVCAACVRCEHPDSPGFQPRIKRLGRGD